jgi:hypothetical protein
MTNLSVATTSSLPGKEYDYVDADCIIMLQRDSGNVPYYSVDKKSIILPLPQNTGNYSTGTKDSYFPSWGVCVRKTRPRNFREE